MKQSLILAIVTSMLIGAGATYAVMNRQQTTSDSSNNTSKTVTASSHDGMNHGGARMSDMSMSAMNAELNGKTGDEFDKSFVSMMIEHHQGAIDMAKQAQTNAKHEELKALANDVIEAQTKEIEQMKDWQKQWGY